MKFKHMIEKEGIKYLKIFSNMLLFKGLFYLAIITNRERRVIGISGSLTWSKTLMELIFNPCGECL